ncbi:MAG: hypothetical protein A2001_13750 [Treponema sp. GWC1_61_84]|nr:MAG: hypothetical protein A2001_13750 [Treponema sp. GWC1_61_84]
MEKPALMADPFALVRRAAAEANAVFVLKGEVTLIAGPDGRTVVVDGLVPALAAGGSGDVLAGLIAALAARTVRLEAETGRPFDPLAVAAVGAALLTEAGRAVAASIGFSDAEDLCAAAGRIAAGAWLPGADRG